MFFNEGPYSLITSEKQRLYTIIHVFHEGTKCLMLSDLGVVHLLALFFCVYQDKSKDSVFGGDYSTLDRLDTTSTNSESKIRVVDEHGSEIDYDDDLDDRMKKVQAFEWPRHHLMIVSFLWGKNPQVLTMSFFTNDHNYSCFDALELKKKCQNKFKAWSWRKKKIHIELRQFCLIYFPESTHSMELRMINFTGYTYYISLYRSRNRKGTLFVLFLFHILFFWCVFL